MITLSILLILILAVVFIVLCFVGGALVIFIDPLIAILVIWLIAKIIKRIKRKS